MADISYRQDDVKGRLINFLVNNYDPQKHLILLNKSEVLEYNMEQNSLYSRADFISLNDPSLTWKWGVFGEKWYITVTNPVYKKDRFIYFYTKTDANQLI